MSRFSRRGFLLSSTAAALGLIGSSPATAARGLAATQQRAMRTTGTTLDTVATPVGDAGYRRLTAGPGWPLVPRHDLLPTPPRADRDDRRTPLASFVQFTDLHVVDAQSPMRFEYLHPLIGSASRPHETLSPLGAAALVEQVNELSGGPFTGRGFDALVCTGDNTDNHETVELDWYLAVLNGGTITPNTGDPAAYEGTQNSGSSLYWNPDSALPDTYKDVGFPHLPGLLDAATRPFRSPGLRVPWYSTFGNHDNSLSGTLPSDQPLLDAVYTGDRKTMDMPHAESRRLASALQQKGPEANDIVRRESGIGRAVTPDSRREPFSPREFVDAHLRPDNTGPGPVGHGFTERNLAEDTAYYTFPIAPGVLGISLDSTNRAGFTDGSLGTDQLDWLEQVLVAGSSRYYDSDGKLARHPVDDQLFVLFSHHTSATMSNLLPDPDRPFEHRHGGGRVLELLNRFPNVLAWVNGHTHENRIIPHRDDAPDRGFWEINTASHVDYPHHARILEITDNGDGTLSLFTTLIESAADYGAERGDLSQAGLGSLYRELAFNDIHKDPTQLGGPADHNTELLLPHPLKR